eukprot:m51a1_g6335 hypothetical protein (323) ;mRNA; r:19725-20919
MDYRDISTGLTHLAACGVALSVEQRAALRGSLAALKRDNKLEHVFLWGRILGVARDYLIAKGSRETLFDRKFFYSHDGIEWVALVDVDKVISAHCNTIIERLTGNPATEHVLEVPLTEAEIKEEEARRQAKKAEAAAARAPRVRMDVPDGSTEEEEESEEETDEQVEEDGPIPTVRKVSILEDRRLAHLIKCIDEATSVVPRGAFVLTAEHNVIPNPSFKGLDSNEGRKPAAYMHLRPMKTLLKRPLLDRAGLSKTIDFLDVLSDDKPKESWAIVPNDSTGAVTIRSLTWPGYYAYHLPGTVHYGSFYLGTGHKNVDLGFLL